MNIRVNFLNGNLYWQSKITASAVRASNVLSDPAFIAKVRAVPKFDYTGDTPGQVADAIAQAGDIPVNVSFYSKLFTRAIAFEDNQGVHFNVCKEKYGAGSAGDLAHEFMHRLGYQHNGNAAAGNENTVPYLIGSMVDEFVNPGLSNA
jgi:hypothetical protein